MLTFSSGVPKDFARLLKYPQDRTIEAATDMYFTAAFGDVNADRSLIIVVAVSLKI
jgi:hypothetical protein